jgi:ferrous iron transport protein A
MSQSMKTGSSKAIPLTLYQAQANSTLKVLAITGGWGARRNLNEVGVHVGDTVRIVRRAPFGGPLIIQSHGAEVAIGRQLAEKVKVELIR